MKNNKWTVGLAAAGLVSLASVAQAQDANSVQTKLATTSLSGYVSTSYEWAIGTDGSNSVDQRDPREDRFALDVISLTLASPQSAGDWGAGYNVQLWVGDDASTLNLGEGGNVAIKNAYLSLNVPVGKGLSVDVGRFDTILGMESIDSNLNPHYTHGNGYNIEPTLHEGLKTSYQLTDNVGLSFLLANTIDASANGASPHNGDRKTYGLALNLTAPDSMGALSGATVDIAYINGRTKADTGERAVQNLYVGATVPVPVDNLSAGVALDVRKDGGGAGESDSVVGLYLEYAASDKLTLNGRVERVNDGPNGGLGDDGWDYTITANYALWAGVTSRLEWRHTKKDNATANKSSDSVYANLIYEF